MGKPKVLWLWVVIGIFSFCVLAGLLTQNMSDTAAGIVVLGLLGFLLAIALSTAAIMIPIFIYHIKTLIIAQNEILQRVDANLCKIAEGPNDQDQPTGQTVDRII